MPGFHAQGGPHDRITLCRPRGFAVVASADHVVEVGPEGGEAGGRITAEGTPEEVAAGATITAPFLRGELARG